MPHTHGVKLLNPVTSTKLVAQNLFLPTPQANTVSVAYLDY